MAQKLRALWCCACTDTRTAQTHDLADPCPLQAGAAKVPERMQCRMLRHLTATCQMIISGLCDKVYATLHM